VKLPSHDEQNETSDFRCSASYTRLAEPSELFLRPGGYAGFSYYIRDAWEVVLLSRAPRRRLRLQLDSVDGLRGRRLRFPQRVSGVLFCRLWSVRRARASSVSRHRLHTAAIPKTPAISALVRQCDAIHEKTHVEEFSIWHNLIRRGPSYSTQRAS
jgi:hypothetical protein